MRLVDYIGDDEERFAELMECFFRGDSRLRQRAAWVVRFTFEAQPALFEPYLGEMIGELDKEVHDAVKRNTLSILCKVEIPEEYLGVLTDVCFRLLMQSSSATAIQIYAMTILGRICEVEPDLTNELVMVIEDQYPRGTAGYKSRARRVLKKLNVN